MITRGYSRREFRRWLTELPPDEPFCSDCQCPITEFMLRSVGRDSFDNRAAEYLDVRLTVALDDQADRTGFGDWHNLTPRMVIAIIDELEARAA